MYPSRRHSRARPDWSTTHSHTANRQCLRVHVKHPLVTPCVIGLDAGLVVVTSDESEFNLGNDK